MTRKVVLYIAMSLDGYIAKHDDNIDFLSVVETPDEDYGYSEFLGEIDTVIWGRRTYDKVLTLGDTFLHKEQLHFKRSISYPSGLVQLCYDVNTESN